MAVALVGTNVPVLSKTTAAKRMLAESFSNLGFIIKLLSTAVDLWCEKCNLFDSLTNQVQNSFKEPDKSQTK